VKLIIELYLMSRGGIRSSGFGVRELKKKVKEKEVELMEEFGES